MYLLRKCGNVFRQPRVKEHDGFFSLLHLESVSVCYSKKMINQDKSACYPPVDTAFKVDAGGPDAHLGSRRSLTLNFQQRKVASALRRWPNTFSHPRSERMKRYTMDRENRQVYGCYDNFDNSGGALPIQIDREYCVRLKD
jgi:hypothetical protein